MGFEGNSPQESMDANASMELFRYLNGDIIHIKIPDKGHNAGSFLTEKTLRDFLGGSNDDPMNHLLMDSWGLGQTGPSKDDS